MSLRTIFWLRGTALIATGAFALFGLCSAEGMPTAPISSGATMLTTSAGEAIAAGASGSSTSESEGGPANLPDAPSTVLAGSVAGFEPMAAGGQNSAVRVAPKYTVDIPAGWTAQSLKASDKVVIGFRDAIDPFSLIGIVLSAGYSDITNGQPNYGTNGKAIGKRLGAVAARDTSETIFSESVFAPVFHQDPRYYVLGHGHSFLTRLFYAGTRPIITRTDGGHQTINASVLAGTASAVALADTYFPQINRNFHDTAADFGGSLGGTALGYVVTEFYHDFAVAMHLKKAD